MAYMNMILIGTLKDNIKYDILSRSCFQFTYFLLFLLDEAQEWISEFTIFRHFPFIRANDHETAAKLLCLVQIRHREDVSTVAANLRAIFTPVGGRNVGISSCIPNSYCLTNVSLQPSTQIKFLPRSYLPLAYGLSLPSTIHMLYFILFMPSNIANTIVISLILMFLLTLVDFLRTVLYRSTFCTYETLLLVPGFRPIL